MPTPFQKKTSTHIVRAALCGVTALTALLHALAQTEPAKEEQEPAGKPRPVKKEPAQDRVKEPAKDGVQKVTISGGRESEVEARRQSTASKLIYGREELDKNGDANLGEVLKRLPGVTIGGRPGRGGDIRMRGMGNGYTQILLNGERPPRGFSMDSLSPDQVERIEIMRGPVAEYSTQAIAGTINIVLREEYRQKNIDLKFSEGFEQGRSAPNLSITYPGESGALSYALSASVYQNRQQDESFTDTTELGAQGQTTLQEHQDDQTRRRTTGVHLAPRLNYRWENGDTLMLQPFLMHAHSDSASATQIAYAVLPVRKPGEPEPYVAANASGASDTTFLRGFGNWQHKFDGSAKLNVKFGGGFGHMNSTSLRDQYNGAGKLIDVIDDVNDTRDNGLNTGGKYTSPLGEDHTLAAGWELEAGNRKQVRTSLDNGLPQFAESGDNLEAHTRRVALFVQDEFDLSKQWSAYAGLRWEGIRTSSSGTSLAVENRSSVWSPVLHSVWRLSGESKDQIRSSFTHAYRAPALNDLIAVPAISNQNSPTRPDRTGNPNLKPELSKGIDLAYEHYLSRAGIMSANLFVRSIDDLMRRRTDLVNTPQGLRWVSAPVNVGHAWTRGIELEAKFQLQEFFPDAAALDLRANYSRFWSSVDDIPGPDNRLDQQPAQTANFGFDYRVAGHPLTLGGNINWTPAYLTQASAIQLNATGIKRALDSYILWKINPGTQLRLSVNNLQAADISNGSVVTTNGMVHAETSSARTYTTWTLRLELKI